MARTKQALSGVTEYTERMGMAGTVVVSARIDEATAARAAACIKAEGLTVGEVIKRFWRQIAAGGELPREETDESVDILGEFHRFQESLPEADPWLLDLKDERVNGVGVSHHA
jgi:antitoxin component of RelBE/YafQ-DinJ toxin-antitoxin module